MLLATDRVKSESYLTPTEMNTDQNFISHFYLFSNYIVGVCPMKDIVLASWDTARNKTDKKPTPIFRQAYVSKEGNNKLAN